MNWKHTILVILNLISVGLIAWITFDVFPKIEVTSETLNADKIDGLIVDLSISVITSTFFYYLLVYIQEARQRKYVKRITQPRTNSVYSTMREVMAYLCYTYNIRSQSGQYSDIDTNALNNINNVRDHETGFWYSIDGKITDVSQWQEIDFLGMRMRAVETYTETLIKLPQMYFEDQELVALVVKINQCRLINHISMLINNKNNWRALNNSNPMNEYLVEFYDMYKALSKFANNNSVMVICPERPNDRKALKVDIR